MYKELVSIFMYSLQHIVHHGRNDESTLKVTDMRHF